MTGIDALKNDTGYEIQEVWLRGVGTSDLDGEERCMWMVVAWFAIGIGFGELTFKNTNQKNWTCDSENMSANFVKAVLNKLADSCKIT